MSLISFPSVLKMRRVRRSYSSVPECENPTWEPTPSDVPLRQLAMNSGTSRVAWILGWVTHIGPRVAHFDNFPGSPPVSSSQGIYVDFPDPVVPTRTMT